MEVTRVRCPCCGMMPKLEQLISAENTPPEVRIFVQVFGGKKPFVQIPGEYKHVGRGKAPGAMSYSDITETMNAKQLAPIKEWFVKRAKAFLASK
jgi:hypothetical protein